MLVAKVRRILDEMLKDKRAASPAVPIGHEARIMKLKEEIKQAKEFISELDEKIQNYEKQDWDASEFYKEKEQWQDQVKEWEKEIAVQEDVEKETGKAAKETVEAEKAESQADASAAESEEKAAQQRADAAKADADAAAKAKPGAPKPINPPSKPDIPRSYIPPRKPDDPRKPDSPNSGTKSSAGMIIGLFTVILAGLFFFRSSSGGVATTSILMALPIVALILGLTFGAPKGRLILLVLFIIITEVVYLGSGQATLQQMIPALLGPGLFAIGFLVSILLPQESRSGPQSIAIIILFVAGLYFIIFHSAPLILAAINSNTLSFGTLENAGAEAVGAGKTSSSSFLQELQKSYKSSMAAASGEKIDGEVDQTVKEDVGLEILAPLVKSPEKVNENEIKTLETGARIKAFDPKQKIIVKLACNMQNKSASQTVTTSLGPRYDLGPNQSYTPKTMEGYGFTNDFTCYPRPDRCGSYVVTISALAEKLRTDAQLNNYIMDKDTLNQNIYKYAQSKGTELRSESAIESAIKAIFPEVTSYKSVSDKGAIKTIMMTKSASLIGVSTDTQLKLMSGIENMKNGWVMKVTKVEITIPEYFKPSAEFCDSWTLSASKLTLKDTYLTTTNFTDTSKGLQKVFPSCLLEFSGASALTDPTLATFLMLVEYDYIVQQTYNLEVKNATGGTCQATTSKSSSKTSTSTSTSSKTTTEKASTTEVEATVALSAQMGQTEFDKAIEPCAGKSSGTSCGTSEYCATYSGKGYCVPQCMYYASKEQAGLAKEYDCITPAANCKSGTTKQYNCKSSYDSGSYTCCIPS